MTGHNGAQDRLYDLLAERATQGLSDVKARELNRLLGKSDGVSADEFELAAAAAELAFVAKMKIDEPMPGSLKERLKADARSCLSAPQAVEVDRPASVAPVPRRRTASPLASAGWLAAAAMLMATLLAWWPDAPTAERTLAEQLQTFVDEVGDEVVLAWSPPEAAGFEGVTGNVVWSPGSQKGFMRLTGMPANDPSVEQYQLWIVDPARDASPVDGGVFDIPAGGGEIIVPIDAKLDILQAAAFAITLEQPGGVVVSDGPLLVVAAAG